MDGKRNWGEPGCRGAESSGCGRRATGPTVRTRRLCAIVAVVIVGLSLFSGASPVVGVASAANQGVDSCATIDSSGTYELTDNVSTSNPTPCIEITASNVTLDGNGYVVEGYSNNTIGSDGYADQLRGSTGVRVAGTDTNRVTNVTIRNVEFEGGNTSINATYASDIEIADVTATSASLQAVRVRETDGNVTLRNVETENSPRYRETLSGNTARTRPAIEIGGRVTDDAAPDRINVTNLHAEESPQIPGTSATVELETDSGPIAVTDSNFSASTRGALDIDAEDGNGFSEGDATVRNTTISDYGNETVEEAGLTVYATADIAISNTSVVRGGTSSEKSDYALLARSDGGSFVFENSTVRNVASGRAVDIVVNNYDRQDGVVRNVTIHNNTDEGFIVSSGGRLDVRDMSITQTGAGWAGSFSGEPVDIRNLTVDQTVERAVQVSSFDEGTSLRDAVVSNLSEGLNPPEPGLQVMTEEGTYRNITVTDTAGPGISLDETDDDFSDRTLTLENSTVENVSGDGIQLDGTELEVRNTSVADANGTGIRHDSDVTDPINVTLQDVSVQNSSDDGVRITEDSTSRFDELGLTEVTVRNATGDEVRLTRVTAAVDGLDLSSATLGGTARSVVINSSSASDRPTPPSDRGDIGVYFAANETTTDGYLNASVQYDDGDVPAGLDEPTLELWRHNGSWSSVGGTVDTSANTVSANITNFSVFAPLGNVSGSPAANVTYSPSTVYVDEYVALNASNSTDPNGNIVDYAWDLTGDGSFDVNGSSATRSHQFTTSGEKMVTLRVTDDDGNTDTVTKNITVKADAPTANFTYSPSTVYVDEYVTLNASNSTDPDGNIVDYAWDLTGDGDFDVNGSSATRRHQFTTAGERAVTLRVTDDDGNTDTVTRNITVKADAPTANFTYSPSSPETDERVTFDGSNSTDSDGDIAYYEWDFTGNGTYEQNSSSPTGNYTYTAAGEVNVTLRVTDTDGNSDTKSSNITISSARSGGGGGGFGGGSDDDDDDPADNAAVNVTVQTTTLSATTVDVGEPVTARVTLATEGDRRANRTVRLRVDGEPVQTTTGSVPTDGNQTVTLSHTFDEAGSYVLAVGNESLGTVTVEADDQTGATATPSSTETTAVSPGGTSNGTATEAETTALSPGGTATSGSGPGFSVVSVVIAVLAAALVAYWRN